MAGFDNFSWEQESPVGLLLSREGNYVCLACQNRRGFTRLVCKDESVLKPNRTTSFPAPSCSRNISERVQIDLAALNQTIPLECREH